MVKNLVKFMLILQLTIILGVVLSFVFKTEIGAPLKTIAGTTNTDSVYVTDENGNVQRAGLLGNEFREISKDNMTITGTAKEDVFITIGDGVETVTIENLDQNGHEVSLNFETESPCKIVFKGENEIYDIYSYYDDITVEGENPDAVLNLTNSIYACGTKLYITAGTIRTPQIYSDGTITITGDCRIYLESMADEDLDCIYARLEAYDLLTIDLTGAGFIDITGDLKNDVYPTYAPRKYVLGQNTEITTPEDGYCELYDPEVDDEYTIFGPDGEEAEHVVIKAVE